MLTFLRLTALLIVLCAFSAGIIHDGSSQQPSSVLALFTKPDGTPCERPCLFGVQPGITSFDQALALLRAHPFTHRFEPNLAGDILRLGNLRIILAWGLGDERVASI